MSELSLTLIWVGEIFLGFMTRLVLPAASTSIFQKFLTAEIWHLVHQNNTVY